MAEPPELQVGDSATVTIDNLAYGGDGVGRVDGLPVFVPDVVPGETVSVEITEFRKRFARARLQSIQVASPQRVAPPCPLVGTCGGCQLQHLAYARAVAAKTEMVRETLRRVGHLADPPVEPCVASPEPFGYRNKLELHAFDIDGRLALGFIGRDGTTPVEVTSCPLASDELNALLGDVRAWLEDAGWPAYDPRTGDGLVRGVALRLNRANHEATLLLTTGRRDIVDKGPRFSRLRRELGKLVGIRHYAKTRASQTATGRPVGALDGRAMRFVVGGLSLRVSPESFFQVNDGLLEPLLEAVTEGLDPQPGDHLADLYGGIGTFGLPLASSVSQVSLVEVDADALRDAETNARFHQLDNVVFRRGQVEQQLGSVLRDGPVDRIVLDPPRAGCSEAVLAMIAAARPKRVVYVSCDPATLARDLARLTAAGLRLLRVQPFDLFAQTTHIETVATLAR